MRKLWILSIFIVCAKLETSGLECDNEDNCACISSPLELVIQCPASSTDQNYRGPRLHLASSEKSVKIDCHNINNFHENLLPNVTLSDVEKLTLDGCPLYSFKKICNHFSLTRLKELEFEAWKNVTLTKKYFEGLDDLKELTLRLITFKHLDADIFDQTPDLISLEVERNTNLTLTANLFKSLSKLEKLRLATNQLTTLPDTLFESLQNLRQLHLFRNNLTVIENGTFRGLTNLTSLDLNGNLIDTISDDAFGNLPQLLVLTLFQNKLGVVTPNLFRSNQKIKHISLSYNRNLTLHDFTFANLPSLEEVLLVGCNLRHLYGHVFENSPNLRKIDLSKNKLTDLPPTLFKGLANLRVLKLNHNFISTISRDIFEHLSNLEEIRLEHNQISHIEYEAFANNLCLRKIDLSSNQYSGNGRAFEHVPNLENLNLGNNHINEMGLFMSSQNFQKLKMLDLSHNYINEVKLNNMSFSGYGRHKATISLAGNPIVCDCHLYELVQHLRNQKDDTFEDWTCVNSFTPEESSMRSLSPRQLTCSENSSCPDNCTCNWRPFDNCMIIDCSLQNLTTFPELNLTSVYLYNQTELHLEGNLLTSGPSNSTGYDNVTRLFLSNNQIRTITWLPPKLEMLALDSNELKQLDSTVLDILNGTNLTGLSLGNNKWSCDCYSIHLSDFLRSHSKIVHVENIHCFDNKTQLLVNLDKNALCYKWLIIYYILLAFLLTSVVTAAALVAIFYRYNYEIKVWLYSHRLCMWLFPEEKLEAGKFYDAYVTFAQEDEDFVSQNLLSVLERSSETYKLCVHSRDFDPGEFTTLEVTKSIVQSRRTLIVLSRNFINGVWGEMEFRTAHTHAMTEGKNRVIVILYGDIDVESLDDELKMYLKTNTYLQWGDPYFWNKLKYALPHRRPTAQKNSQKVANIMKYIDDKFKLVVPTSPSPGTTPPILSLDANKLKNHFVFVPEEGKKVEEEEIFRVSSYI